MTLQSVTQTAYYESVSDSADTVEIKRSRTDDPVALTIAAVAEQSEWTYRPQLCLMAVYFSGTDPEGYDKYTGGCSPPWNKVLKAMAFTVYRQDIRDELRQRGSIA